MPPRAPTEIRFQATLAVDYPNVIQRGAAAELGAMLHRVVGPRRVAIVSDTAVARHHAAAVTDSFRAVGDEPLLLTIPAGERSKSRGTAERLTDRLLAGGVHRRSIVVALGGGVVCDTVGYVAATYMRGIDYVNVPTSLIAQVDAAIGGKVAVNHPRAKNFIGAFHHPRAVVIDPELLATLPTDELRNGLAEVVKVAMIGSPGLFDLIEREGTRLLLPDASLVLDRVIAEAVRIKLALLAPDPFEVDLRRVLNFGHTVAHPLEVAKGFRLRHGYAVSIGMVLAARVALRRGLVDRATVRRLVGLLAVLGLPTEPPPVDPAVVWQHVEVVRRTRAGLLHYVVPTGIGRTAFLDDLEPAEFFAAFTGAPEHAPLAPSWVPGVHALAGVVRPGVSSPTAP